MLAHSIEKPDQSATLTKAFLNAGKALGLTQDDLSKVVGKDRTVFRRSGLNPGGKSGELALLVVRLYRSLYALVGGKERDLRHWMKTENRHTGGVPADQIKSISGLIRVVEYLDAMRGRI
jgi:hypothetical protein